jgi:hypothetical protein
MKIKERIARPKPRFFSRLSRVGLCIAAAGGALLGAPVALPALLLKLAGYLVVSGGVISAVSQATVKGERE